MHSVAIQAITLRCAFCGYADYIIGLYIILCTYNTAYTVGCAYTVHVRLHIYDNIIRLVFIGFIGTFFWFFVNSYKGILSAMKVHFNHDSGLALVVK